MQQPVFKDDESGKISAIQNMFGNAEALVDFSKSLPDGISFSRSEGKKFKYRGVVLAPGPSKDNVIMNYLFETLIAQNILGQDSNLAVLNKIDAGQNPTLNYSNINELVPMSRIVLMNIGDVFTVETTSSDNSTLHIPLKGGDMVIFEPANIFLDKNKYEFIITDNLPRSFITFVTSNEFDGNSIQSIRPTTPASKSYSVAPLHKPGNFLSEPAGVIPAFRGSCSRKPRAKIQEQLDMGEGVIEIQGLTKFELTAVIGRRANDIADNYPILINYGNEYNPVIIASMEIEAAKTNPTVREGLSYIQIRRKAGNGDVLIPISNLI